MARFVFSKESEFFSWVVDHFHGDRFEAYVTASNEVIIYPRKSSRPISYAYIQCSTQSVAELVKKLKELGLEIYNVSRVEWADDRMIGYSQASQE